MVLPGQNHERCHVFQEFMNEPVVVRFKDNNRALMIIMSSWYRDMMLGEDDKLNLRHEYV